MVFKEYLLLLFLSHIIGDFYFFTGKANKEETVGIRDICRHCLCYFIPFVIIIMPFSPWGAVLYGIFAALTHGVFEALQYCYNYRIKKEAEISCRTEQKSFILYQLLQIGSLIIIAYMFELRVGKLWIANGISGFFDAAGISKTVFLSWTTAILALHRPANALISKILAPYRPSVKKNTNGKSDNNAGRFIGTVERLIMLMLISIGQYSAIGLVLTAKSIARYNKIVKKPRFAEYYLLGTLLSTAVVIGISVIV